MEAIAEVSSKWGNRQFLNGPALVVPYTYRWVETNRDGQEVARTEPRFAVFLPDALEIRGTAETEIRKRGIYSVPVYRLDLNLAGKFSRPDFAGLSVEPAAIAWDRAHLVVGIADTRAIQRETAVSWNGKPVSFVPGTGAWPDVGAGIHAVVGFAEGADAVEFSVPLSLNGSQGVYFAPFGQNTTAVLKSNYPHPSFQGNWLPAERMVSADGFEASYQQRVERFGDVPAHGAAVPVVLGGDRAGETADRCRQRRPDQYHVEVAGVVRKIDALTGVRLAIDPADARTAEDAGADSQQKLRNHRKIRLAGPSRRAATRHRTWSGLSIMGRTTLWAAITLHARADHSPSRGQAAVCQSAIGGSDVSWSAVSSGTVCGCFVR
jgi:hypothetical protein